MLGFIAQMHDTHVTCRFQEEVALGVRMTAIGDTVEELGLPDFICLQVQPPCWWSCLLDVLNT